MVSSQENVDHNDSPSKVQHQVSPRRKITFSRETDDVSSHSSSLRKHLQGPNTLSHELSRMHSSEYTHSFIHEKVRKDGYKWKKYGEKKIKKSKHKRGYYECTHSNCQAKKKFHWSEDWTIEYFTYTNQHNHHI